MKGVGAAGVAGVVGGGSTVAASEHEADDGDSGDSAGGEFAAVRVGNLVPDVAADSSGDSDSQGRGPPMDTPGRQGANGPGSTALDVYVGKPPDGNPTIGNVHYRAFGPGPGDSYLQVPEHEYDVTVTRSGDTEPLLEDSIDLEAEHRYTALAAGRISPEDDESELQSLVIEDGGDREDVTPPEDMAEASFVHASPNAGPVDIIVDGVAVLEDVEFGDVSNYQAVPPGEREVEVQADDDAVLSLTRELVAGTRITLYVTGLAGVDEFPNEDGHYGLSGVASVDGLNPLPAHVLTR